MVEIGDFPNLERPKILADTQIHSNISKYWRRYQEKTLQQTNTPRYISFSSSTSQNYDFAVTSQGSVDIFDGLSFEVKYSLNLHSSLPLYATFRQDGRTIAVGTDRGHIIIYDSGSRKKLRDLGANGASVRVLQYVIGGKLIVAGKDDGTVCVYAVDTNELIGSIKGHNDYIRCISCHNSQSIIATGSDDKCVCIWRVTEGQTQVLTLLKRITHNDPVNQVLLLANGTELVSAASNMIFIWDILSDGKEPIYAIEAHQKTVTGLTLVVDGNKEYILSGSLDGIVKVHSTVDLSLIHTFHVPGPISVLTSSVDMSQRKTSHIAIGTSNNIIQIMVKKHLFDIENRNKIDKYNEERYEDSSEDEEEVINGGIKWENINKDRRGGIIERRIGQERVVIQDSFTSLLRSLGIHADQKQEEINQKSLGAIDSTLNLNVAGSRDDQLLLSTEIVGRDKNVQKVQRLSRPELLLKEFQHSESLAVSLETNPQQYQLVFAVLLELERRGVMFSSIEQLAQNAINSGLGQTRYVRFLKFLIQHLFETLQSGQIKISSVILHAISITAKVSGIVVGISEEIDQNLMLLRHFVDEEEQLQTELLQLNGMVDNIFYE